MSRGFNSLHNTTTTTYPMKFYKWVRVKTQTLPLTHIDREAISGKPQAPKILDMKAHDNI